MSERTIVAASQAASFAKATPAAADATPTTVAKATPAFAFVKATPIQSSTTTQADEAALQPPPSASTRTPYGSVRAAAAAIDASQPARRPPSPSRNRAVPSASPRAGYQRNYSPRCVSSPATASDGQSTPRQRQREREEQAEKAALEKRAAIASKMQRAEAARDNAVHSKSDRARQENRRAQTKSAEIARTPRSPRPVVTPRSTSPGASRPTAAAMAISTAPNTPPQRNGTPPGAGQAGVGASIIEQYTVGGEAVYRVELGVRPLAAAQSEQLRLVAQSADERVARDAPKQATSLQRAASPQRATSPQKATTSPQKVWRPSSPQAARTRGMPVRSPVANGGLAAWSANATSRTAEQAKARKTASQLLDRLFAAGTNTAPAHTPAADPARPAAEPAAAVQAMRTDVAAMVAAAASKAGARAAEKVEMGMDEVAAAAAAAEKQTRELLKAQEEAATVRREAELAATRKAAEEAAAAREAVLRREAEEAAARAAQLERAQAAKIAELERTLEQQKLAAADPRLFDKGAPPAETPPPQQRPTRPPMASGATPLTPLTPVAPVAPAADSAGAAPPEQLEQMVVEAAASALKQTLDARRQASHASSPAVEMHVRLSNEGFSVNVQLCPEAQATGTAAAEYRGSVSRVESVS